MLDLAEHLPEAHSDIQSGLDELLDWQARIQAEFSLTPARVPKFKELLRTINRPVLYGNYIVFSQFSHGGSQAAEVFARQRSDGTYGDVIRLRDWFHALAFPCMAFRDAAFQTIRYLGLSRSRFLPRDFRESLDHALTVLDNGVSITPGV